MSERWDQTSTEGDLPEAVRSTGDAASLDAALGAAESTVKYGGEPSPLQVVALKALVAAHPERAKRLARRLDLVFATTALRSREVPDGVLDGLYDDIRAGAVDHRFGRARMSTAFLEAPRSLVAWRRMAVAASVLLAVGGIWLGMRDPVSRQSRSSPLAIEEDPRYGLLEPLSLEAGPFGGVAGPAALTTPAGLSDPARSTAPRADVMLYIDGQHEWRVDPGIARSRSARSRSARSGSAGSGGAREGARAEEGR
jgi:hypothetical protein